MEYIKKVLGIDVRHLNAKFEHLPNYICTRYDLRLALLNDTKVIFIYPKTELEKIDSLKKHMERIQNSNSLPGVLILSELNYRQKEYLIRERIPFVVEGKQIYLPFMALYLQEKCNAPKLSCEKILPSTQMLFLYFIYKGGHEISTSQASKDLNLTPTSLSRASKQLETLNLVQIRKEGVNKIIFSKDSPEVLFQNSKEILMNPVKRIVYIPKENVNNDLIESGYMALSHYSMLNESSIKCYATSNISKWNKISTNTLYDSKKQVALEIWRYDPKKLSNLNRVDVLSLALSLLKDADERVEEAIEEMLNNLWRKINGNRN